MILDSEIEVTISNNGKYWLSLGYSPTKQGSKILVKVFDLPIQSNKRVRCKCDECGVEFDRQYQLLLRPNKCYEGHLCNSCSRKLIGENLDRTHILDLNKNQTGPNHPRWNPNKKAFQEYAYKVRRITEENYAKYSQDINPYSLPRTLCGVEGGYQLDHRISIHKGFKFGISPKVIGSAENLQILPWKDNRNKHK